MTMIVHFADVHLGQRLVASQDDTSDRIDYEDAQGENEEHLRRVLDDVSRLGLPNIVFGGDIGSRSASSRFFELLGQYGMAPSIVLGNHDSYADVAPHAGKGRAAIERKLCSSHDDGTWRFITLDTSDNSVGTCQLAWLAGELRGASRLALFVHHPVLAIDTHIDRRGAALIDRQDLRALLETAACDVWIFCGHYHMIDEAREANIKQFATPAVSYQILKQPDRVQVDVRTFGYRIIEFDGPDVRTRCVLLTDSA